MKTFQEYITEKVPNYEEVLDANTLSELKIIWDEAQKAMKQADYCLEMQFKGRAGIDYTTDFEKYNAISSRKMAELNDKIQELTMPKIKETYENSFRF